MDWNLFSQLLVTFSVAALSWWFAHHFSARRDLANERRKLRVSYLLEAYRKLERASNRDDLKSYWTDFESAIADIQSSLARQFATGMAAHHTASLDELIFDLRQSLRSELELEPVSDKVVYLRIRQCHMAWRTRPTSLTKAASLTLVRDLLP
jgi:hypothetical protein